MIVVLVVASGAAWESTALGVLADDPRTVVLKRCVDVDDLLAAAASGQAQVAVLGLETRGLDVAAVAHLTQHAVVPVAVVDDLDLDAARVRAGRIGVTTLVRTAQLSGLAEAVVAAAERPAPAPLPTPPASQQPAPPLGGGPGPSGPLPSEVQAGEPAPGRVIAVWGPAGAPGRSTLAAGIAAELARRGRRTLLVDADPWGGSIAQQLGVMDEVSGLLAAARLANAGRLEERWPTVARGLDARLSVVTGLPRPDRWVEVRGGTLEHLLELAARGGEVVVDTGFSLETDPVADVGGRPGRNHLTLGALEVADEVVVVGAADPVGLARLARGLAELHEVAAPARVRVVVNRMRPSLGWSERDVAAMVQGFAPVAGLHFLPEDRAAVDRALVAGRTLPESGDSALTRALAPIVAELAADVPVA